MKLSLKVQDPHCSPAPPQSPPSQLLSSHQKQPETRPLLLRAKIPITIFNLPFLSGFSTTTHHPSDLTLSLATNFSSGPNLKLAYTAAAASSSSISTPAAVAPPLTLTLKSGIGVYGSPRNSPLIISANFSFSPHSPNPNPTFSLLLKPNLGSFSLKKATSSNPNPSPKSETNSFGFVPLERPMSLKDFSLEDYGKDSIFRGISVMARTEMPVTNRISMKCRWGVNFPEDLGKQMPNLTLNKIGISRADEVKEVNEKKNESGGGGGGEVELLKGMCFWMKRELDNLQRENREMKLKLEEMKMGHLLSSHGGETIGKKVSVAPVVVETSSSGFEQWRNKKNGGGDNGKKEGKKNVSNGNRVDVESELQKAIKAASSSSSSSS